MNNIILTLKDREYCLLSSKNKLLNKFNKRELTDEEYLFCIPDEMFSTPIECSVVIDHILLFSDSYVMIIGYKDHVWLIPEDFIKSEKII